MREDILIESVQPFEYTEEMLDRAFVDECGQVRFLALPVETISKEELMEKYPSKA